MCVVCIELYGNLWFIQNNLYIYADSNTFTLIHTVTQSVQSLSLCSYLLLTFSPFQGNKMSSASFSSEDVDIFCKLYNSVECALIDAFVVFNLFRFFFFFWFSFSLSISLSLSMSLSLSLRLLHFLLLVRYL